MPSPLDREWQADADRLRSTTAWILNREPVLVRVAPAVILLVVVALALWAATSEVAVYQSVTGRVDYVGGGTAADTLEFRFDAEPSEDVRVGSPVVLIPGGNEDARVRIDASVARIARPRERGSAPVATLVVAEATPAARGGPATLRIEAGRRTLLAELFATARGGRGRS